jgi:hypothetical protein
MHLLDHGNSLQVLAIKNVVNVLTRRLLIQGSLGNHNYNHESLQTKRSSYLINLLAQGKD